MRALGTAWREAEVADGSHREWTNGTSTLSFWGKNGASDGFTAMTPRGYLWRLFRCECTPPDPTPIGWACRCDQTIGTIDRLKEAFRAVQRVEDGWPPRENQGEER